MDFGRTILDVKNDKGHVRLYRPKHELVVAVSEGFITRDLWPPQQPVYEQILAEVPRLSLYRDAWNVRSVEGEYREASQGFVKQHRERFGEILFLQRSAVIALAINAAALFTRAPLSAVDQRTFEAKLSQALGRKAA
ncbi:MAG: hypothetical protein SFW67_03365 [Myxococcaceae bacterium]|nr:hypothetical protein [Myxococcaceae bacterium]